MHSAKRNSIAISFLAVFWALTCYSSVRADLEVAEIMEDARARMQAARWNVARAIKPTNPETEGVSIVTIAGVRKRQLREWMRTCPPPTPEEMNGTWRGLNRGLGPAVLGFSQFAKHMCTRHGCGHGDNITIKQVGPCGWCEAQNWKAIRKDGRLDRKGNYSIQFDDGAVLNYGAAENPACDPSRFVVDKIVKLNDRFLLGKATYKVGLASVTIAYFVLERN